MQVTEWLATGLGRDIWNRKYRYDNETFDEWLDRVSGKNEDIKKLIIEKKFLFGGRILASRGLQNKGRKITFSNCYVITPPEDNIESIFDCAKKLARTYSYGGGCGIDISKLSPRNAKINNAAKETSGSVSFMDLYSLVTQLIGQQGRRGALMISLDCRHPDLEEFINVKSDLNKITKANLSIRITDDFINAVENNDDWELIFVRKETGEVIQKTIKAKDLFKEMAIMNWNYAEPGLLNWDRITKWNLLSEDKNFSYAGVNPCAEEPLPAGGSCLLGSINLSKFVINPFTKDAKFNFNDFKDTVRLGVFALNEVLHEGLPLHPLQEQKESVNNWRQIGLGILGWHDALIKLGIRYGDQKSLKLANRIGFDMIDTAISYSAQLTDRYGTYPMFNYDYISQSKFFIENTSESTKEIVKQKGLANSQLLTIAPTGSIGTMLGVSTGIEPIYEFSYTRKTESLYGKDEYYKVYTPIVKEYISLKNSNKLPDYFNTAMTLNYKERIEMQSVWQKYIDASISSTVNVPTDFSVEEVEDLYKLAWKKGLKGVTIYRSGCKRDGILKSDNMDNIEENILVWGTTIESSDDLIGKKRKIMSGCGSIHIVAFFDFADGKLMEIFLNKGSQGGCNSWMTSNSRTISAALRTGTSFEYLMDQLKSAPACPSYVTRTAIKKDTSKGHCCPAAVANALEEMQNEVFDELGIFEEEEREKIRKIIVNQCPECGEELKFEGGCNSCSNCGYSKCD